MYGLRLFVLSGLALSFALAPLAMAADESLKIDESKPRQSRGIGFPTIDAASSVQAPVAAPVTVPKNVNLGKTVDTKKPTPKVATTKPAKPQIITAHPKAPKTTRVNTDVARKNTDPKSAPVQTQTDSTNAGSAMLVDFKQKDGAVISASLDKKGDLPKYRVGDNMVVNVKAHQDCNVVVFNYDSTGNLTQIYPNDYQQNGFVRANETIEIGGPDSKFDYQISGKGGPEKIFVYAYPTGSSNPLKDVVALAPIAGTPFRGSEITVDEYRNLVNRSTVFFSRSVQVVPKKNSAQLVSSQPPTSTNNKIELTFMVEK